MAPGSRTRRRDRRHRRARRRDGDGVAGRVPRRGRWGRPRRSRTPVAAAAPARCRRRRRRGRGRADGNPLVGTAFMLELGRRRALPQRRTRDGGPDRWIRRVGDQRGLRARSDPPHRARRAAGDFSQAVITALFIGAIAGAITSLAGAAIYRARGGRPRRSSGSLFGGLGAPSRRWRSRPSRPPRPPSVRAAALCSGQKTIDACRITLLAVGLLRAAATTAAVAAGGCGGVFVPFLAVGDIAGRVFAPGSAWGTISPVRPARRVASPAATGCPSPRPRWCSGSAARAGDVDLPGHRGRRDDRGRGGGLGPRSAHPTFARPPRLARPNASATCCTLERLTRRREAGCHRSGSEPVELPCESDGRHRPATASSRRATSRPPISLERWFSRRTSATARTTAGEVSAVYPALSRVARDLFGVCVVGSERRRSTPPATPERRVHDHERGQTVRVRRRVPGPDGGRASTRRSASAST